MSNETNHTASTPIDPEDRSQLLALTIAEAAADIKAVGIRIIDVRKLVSYTDYLVICHGTSSTHCNAISEAIRQDLKDAGVTTSHVEGTQSREWILLDFFDAVVHIFIESARREYAIESLFNDAPRVPFDEGEPWDTESISSDDLP